MRPTSIGVFVGALRVQGTRAGELTPQNIQKGAFLVSESVDVALSRGIDVVGVGSALPSDRGIRVEVVGIPEVQELLVAERMNGEVVLGKGVGVSKVVGKRHLGCRRDGRVGAQERRGKSMNTEGRDVWSVDSLQPPPFERFQHSYIPSMRRSLFFK